MHRIGEIADATGMTVRTLRYYEEIGLIEPETRTEAGHRLYGDAAVGRLYRISTLRTLGLPLDGVRKTIDGSADDLAPALRTHLVEVEQRLEAEQRLRRRLRSLIDRLADTQPEPGDTTSDLLELLEDMTMLDTTLNKRIALLVYRDIESAFDWLKDSFGFGPGELTRDPDGTVVHGEIQAGDGEIWLHPESPDFDLASPASVGKSTSTMAVMVDDVDAHHRFAAERGARIVYEPLDQPYGYREYLAADCEGHLWSFMKPLD